MQRALGPLAGFVLLAACASAPVGARVGGVGDAEPPPQPTAADGLRGLGYTIRIDPELTRISVELCFRGKAPERLVYGSRPGVLFVRDPEVIAEGGIRLPRPRSLPLVDDHIRVGALPEDACIAYGVDLRAALEHDHLLVAYPCDGGLVTSTELFLWRPPRRAAGLPVTARFELPAGMGASLPWQPDPSGEHRYVLDESAFAFTGHAMFGKLTERTLPLPSSTLTTASPGGFSAEQLDLIARWLENAGRVVSMPAGRFPVSRVQVIVVPTSPNVFPIRFGHTGRSGGASILIFMPTDVDRTSLREDWIAIHEFSHLLHPFVRREDAWLSEGLATYLQEVLRVRAGMLSEADAWRRMYEGAALGRSGEGGLAAETRRMPYAGNYQRVYWAGAAIALMADVELRRRTQGRMSLDTALAGLLERPGLMQRPASAATLIRALDEATGGTTFRDVAARFLEGEKLPELSALYRKLGLLDARGKLGVRVHAPLSWVRDAITAPAPERASLPLAGS